MKNEKISSILIELTDAIGFDHSKKHLEAYQKAEQELLELFDELKNHQNT